MRKAIITRKTKETDISVTIDIDGSGKSNISTGIGFFDHMLEALSKHSLIDIDLKCEGDLVVDCHHTVEDCGIALGMAIKKALGDKSGINRYASAMIPLDEALSLCAVDLSGRAYLVFDAHFETDRVGYFDTEMTEEFFYALTSNAKLNLHLKQLSGKNSHHIIESMFKSFAVALRNACETNPRISGALSTKGVL